MGNVCNHRQKSMRKVLKPEEAENKKIKEEGRSRNHRHSLEEKILPIPIQQIPDIEAEEDNATLMEAGCRGDDNLCPLLRGKSYEELNHYVSMMQISLHINHAKWFNLLIKVFSHRWM